MEMQNTAQNGLSVTFVVPVYNEEREVANAARKLKELAGRLKGRTQIIFVNDGSRDKTAEILAGITGVDVFHHQVNLGYGAALKTGLNQAKNDWLAIVDCDGTYPIDQLEDLIREAQNPMMHMVVGARKINFSWDQPFHKLARWILRRMVKTLTGQMVPDLNSGMRIFRRDLYLQFRHLLPMGFSFTTTITVASLYQGYWVKYIPIPYGERTGRSHIRPVRDFLGFVMLITRLASYFEPLRFFLPISMTTFGIALLKSFRDIIVTGRIGSLAVILVFFSLQTFLTGVIADIVVRRSMMPRD